MTDKAGSTAEISVGGVRKVKEIGIADVKANKTLEVGVDCCAIDRCKAAIGTIGIVQTPVIGSTGNGRIVLSGQCEFTALKALGVKKMDAIEIDVGNGKGEAAKIALLLISLQAAPNALCEGLLLQDAVNAGIPRSELTKMLDKSASWVSNRLALVTRLDSGVFEMVKNGLLDPRSAQEVARLPEPVQFMFAEKAVQVGLPKSVIESLVAGYNDESCPDSVKEQIIKDPQSAIKRLTDKRRAVKTEHPEYHTKDTPSADVGSCIKATQLQMAKLCRILFNESPYSANPHFNTLRELDDDITALLVVVRRLISPGKAEVAQHAG